MATIAIGDVHGSLAPLRDLLDQLATEVRAGDTVVFLGDLIDKGPDTRACIEAVLEFRDRTPGDLAAVCGNHEDWLLRALKSPLDHSWVLGMQPWETIRSYAPEAAVALHGAVSKAGRAIRTQRIALPYELFFDRLPVPHRRFLEGMRAYVKTPDCLCVHGGLDCRVARLQDQPRDAVIWGGSGFPMAYDGPDVVVYGHRNNAFLDRGGWPRPRLIGRTIGLDTIAHGVLTAMRLPDGQVFQSAQYALEWEQDPLHRS